MFPSVLQDGKGHVKGRVCDHPINFPRAINAHTIAKLIPERFFRGIFMPQGGNIRVNVVGERPWKRVTRGPVATTGVKDAAGDVDAGC